MNYRPLPLSVLFLSLFFPSSTALVHLKSKPFSFTFLDAPARFTAPIDASGICGSLHVADPVDACSPLRNNGSRGGGGGGARFVLIARGVCSFEEKIRAAQDGGFDATIINDDQEKSSLYSMIGNSAGINIHAVFVSKMAGETLKKFARVLATFLFARNCRLLRNGIHNRPPSMKRHAVEILPSFTFKSACLIGKRISETCAICLEDYKDGEMLRVLPCLHEFHSICVDSWLTKWGTFCPVCKQEVNSGD
ncbi:receptor homology region, transmembrane domain- and RING domain-containing protein 1 [Typha angustifolia]|uniref:receptor homology region, transmembrane domain- and RING domain-containing protein 1 n=1 Tax=Typha angustifolia TaxID=59011 RepID=UPI003C2FC7FC